MARMDQFEDYLVLSIVPLDSIHLKFLSLAFNSHKQTNFLDVERLRVRKFGDITLDKTERGTFTHRSSFLSCRSAQSTMTSFLSIAFASIIGGVAVLTILWYFYYFFFFQRVLPNAKWPRRTYPLMGHLPCILPITELYRIAILIRKELGKTFKGLLLFNTFVFTSDEKLIEKMATSKSFLSKAAEYDYMRPWLGDGLLTSTGSKWSKRRKLLTPSFHFNILEDFVSVFNHCGDILVDKLKAEVGNERTDVYPYITLCALDVIYEATMGVKVNAQIKANSEYVRAVFSETEIIFTRMYHPLKRWNVFYKLSRDCYKEKANLKIMHQTTDSIIIARRELLLSNGDRDRATKRKSFVDILLESTVDGQPLSNLDIREEVDTFLFEGHDTTSSAIGYTLYELSVNQQVQSKAVDELKAIFGSDRYRAITSGDLSEMKYLEMVIKEALRKYPAVPIVARKIEDDFTYEGVKFPKGVTYCFVPYLLHREEETFPDPERFDPERFSPENRNKIGPYAYVPFSAGFRNCIGQKFAMMELKSLLAKVLRSFRLLPVKGFQPKNVAQLILRSSNGIQLKLMERSEWL